MNTIIINSGTEENNKILHLIRQAIISFELSANKLIIFMDSGILVEFETDGEYVGINPQLAAISEKIKNFLASTSSVLNVETNVSYKITKFGNVETKPQSNTKRKSK